MKTLSQLKKTIKQPKGTSGTTAYYPKNDDAEFVDQHDIEVVDDANGNDDEMFKGTKVSTANRRQERHGYTSPEDEAVYESKKSEEIVKGMKKNLKDFKSRYGKDAESVMYATANKLANESIELEEGVEETDVHLLEFFLSLDEDNRELMAMMIEEGLEDQILQFVKEESESLNG